MKSRKANVVAGPNERYVITDGLRFLTGGGNYVSDPSVALKFVTKENAEKRLAEIRPMVGTAFQLRRLNLNTYGVR